MSEPKVFASDAVPPGTLLAASGAMFDPNKMHVSVDEAVEGGDVTWRFTVKMDKGALTFMDAAKVVGIKERG